MALALAGAALAAAGCGGSSTKSASGTAGGQQPVATQALSTSTVASAPKGPPLTRAELVAKAEPICARAFAGVFEEFSVTQRSSIPTAAAKGARYARHARDELAALNPPPSMAHDWHVIVASYQRLARAMALTGESVKRGGKPSPAVIAEFMDSQRERSAVANKQRFKECARR
jgi:hypothetical protein